MLLGFAQILIFLFFPPHDRRDKPASFGQIAFVFDKIEKLLLSDQRENQQNALHFV